MGRIKTAVIMAAGMGTRFGNKTEFIPKGFIPVNGVPMIIRSIDTLLNSGITRIVIGTGYLKEKYEELAVKYPMLEFSFSEKYKDTNSMWTLCNCKEVVGNDDFILLESDLVFEQKAITELINNEKTDVLLAAGEVKFQDQYFVEYNEDKVLTNCSTDRTKLNVCGEFVGIHKISNSFYNKLCRYYEEIKNTYPRLGYEFGLLHTSQQITPLYVHKINNLVWYEIDDEKDLIYAEKLFR
jgi:2-aminoethylphosphonate-pyruvate transaminase